MGEQARKPDRTIPLMIHLLPPPEWKTRDDVLQYLGEELPRIFGCFEDVAISGVRLNEIIFSDFANVCEAAAAFLEKPGRLEVDDQRLDRSAFQSLAHMLSEFSEKLDDDGGTRNGEGLYHDCTAHAPETLAELTVSAYRAFSGEAMRVRKAERRDALGGSE